jgi:hypothetical protein
MTVGVQSLCEAEKLKLSSDGGNPGSKKGRRCYDEVCRNLHLAGVSILERGCRFFVDAFSGNLASGALKLISYLVHFIKKF